MGENNRGINVIRIPHFNGYQYGEMQIDLFRYRRQEITFFNRPNEYVLILKQNNRYEIEFDDSLDKINILYFDNNGNDFSLFKISLKSVVRILTIFYDHKGFDVINEVLRKIQTLKERKRLAIIHVMQNGQEKAAGRSYLASDHNPFARQVAEYAGLRGGKKCK
jgi:hypothetical protein